MKSFVMTRRNKGTHAEAGRGTRQAVVKSSEQPRTLIDGITSLHSWIRTQTMIRQSKIIEERSFEAEEEDEEEDEVIIHLTSKNPQAIGSFVKFDMKKGEYVKVHLGKSMSMIDHLNIKSTILHRDSEKAKAQKEIFGDPVDFEKCLETEENTAKVVNKFKHVERGSQTKCSSKRNSEIQTDAPPYTNFSASVNRWAIHDTYEEYEEMMEKKEAEEKEAMIEGVKTIKSPEKSIMKELSIELDESSDVTSDEVNEKMIASAKILERMVNQNTYSDIAFDFRYWDDGSDDFKEVEGSLLPLWKFSYEPTSNLDVTSISWNPHYQDLFAVGYGSYNFYIQPEAGKICLFSLKNPSYPEFVCRAPCGVMCVDFNPFHPHMLAAGLHDGNIAIYNLQKNKTDPLYISDARNGKHRDIAWQVKWAKDDIDGYLNLYSVSGDGHVTNWTIIKTILTFSDVFKLKFTKDLKNMGEEKVYEFLTDGGRSFAMKPDSDDKFVVGTEEGEIYLCTTHFSSKALKTYSAHNTPVQSICWNPFLTNVFITCASEMLVKIWSKDMSQPMFRFDLQSQVCDVSWAPYSSTIFAAVTVDGKVHIYDLSINKYNPICVQPIVHRKKARLNHLAFNASHPVILVGDSCGVTHCLKLSPNCRRQNKEIKKAVRDNDEKLVRKLEVKKLERLLEQVSFSRDKDSDKSD